MTMDADKIIKLEAELKMLKETLVKYKNLFNEDGYIDTEEQQELNRMEAIISKAETKIAETKQGTSPKEDNLRKEMSKGLSKLKSELESMMTLFGLE